MSLTPQQPPEGRPTRPRVIKRYANRKLYDTRDSRYVTLQQIAEYVRGGEEVSIIDNTTKEDLTNVTLAQILYEEERKGGDRDDEGRRSAPSVGALRHLIQQSGERLMSTLRDIAPGGAVVTKLITRREPPAPGAEETEIKAEPTEVAPAPERPSDRPADAGKNGEAPRRSLLLGPKEVWDELQRLADDRIKAVLGHAIGHVQQLENDVKRLRGRIEELEQKLAASSRREHGSGTAPPGTPAPGADEREGRH